MSLRCTLLLIIAGHAISSYLFLNGFMLTRLQLPDTSKCDDHNALGTNNAQCWTAPRVDKVVILLVDALRYDFVVSGEVSSQSPELQGHMPRLSELVAAYHSRVSMSTLSRVH